MKVPFVLLLTAGLLWPASAPANRFASEVDPTIFRMTFSDSKPRTLRWHERLLLRMAVRKMARQGRHIIETDRKADPILEQAKLATFLGILSLGIFLIAPFAIVTGRKALRKAKGHPQEAKIRNWARLGIILGIVPLVALVILLILAITGVIPFLAF